MMHKHYAVEHPISMYVDGHEIRLQRYIRTTFFLICTTNVLNLTDSQQYNEQFVGIFFFR